MKIDRTKEPEKMRKILVELMPIASKKVRGYIDDQSTGYNMSKEIYNLIEEKAREDESKKLKKCKRKN